MVVPHSEQQCRVAVIVHDIDVDTGDLAESPHDIVVAQETGLHQDSPVFSPGATTKGGDVDVDAWLTK